MAERKTGQYYFGRHRRLWGVWQWNGTGGSFVQDFRTREEAREFVYTMNGWRIKEKK